MSDCQTWGGQMNPPNPPTATEVDNLVTGRLLGPRGQVLSEIRERSTVRLGLASKPKTPSRVQRRT